MKKGKIKLNNNLSGDIWLGILTVFIAVFGVVMIYSASSYSSAIYYNDKFYFVKKQAVGVILGGCALIGFSFINYNIYKKFKLVFAIIGALLLGLVLVPGLGIESYGAKRWIGFGSFSFQPSEIAKFCFVFYSASTLASKPSSHQGFWGSLKVILVGGAYCILIMLEPNMSVTMLLCFVLVFMLFFGGLKISRFLIMLVPALLGVIALILIEPYRLARLMAFINPWASPLGEGYQLIQSLYSFGNGGLFGVGLFQSRQKYLFLPFSESDFIFSIIGEELGLVGCVFVMLVFVVLIYKGFQIAFRAKDRFGCYLAAGITSVLAVQVVLNIAVVTGSIPPTGLPLPFISAGSTSLVVFMAMMGVLINISKNQPKSAYFWRI